MAGLFGGGMKAPQAQEQPAVGSLNVSTSAYGLVRPWIRGRQRVPVNMLWYGDFLATAHQSGGGQEGGKGGGGGGGGGSTSYTYSASFAEAVCEGPITGIGKVWEAKNETTVAAMGGTVILGDSGQDPWPFLASSHPAEAVSYSGLAYIGLPNYQLGGYPNTPNLSVEVLTPSEFSAEIHDAMPSLVVEEFLADTSFPASKVGDLSAYGTYCQAMGIFISPALIEQAAANSTLQEWLTATNSEAVWSGGVLSIVPYGDTEVTGNGVTFTPNLTPEYDLGDDDFFPEEGEDPVICTRPDSADAYNRYSVEFKDRANAYNVAVATVEDQAHIDQFGLRAAPVFKAHFITDAETAELVARVLMAKGLYVRAQYEFMISWRHSRLDAMDLVTLTDSGLGLDRELVRITEIEWPEDYGPGLVKAEEVPGAIAAQARYATQATNPYSANFNADPGDANAPVIFEPPGAITETGLEVWVAASGGPLWGGAEVWLSQDGDTYARVGNIAAPIRQGVLTAALPTGGAADSINTLSVDLSMSRGVLNSASAADAVALNSICYVDGELMAYTTATLTGANAYGLTGLVRGAYGTTIGAHASGSQFARLDGAVFRYPFLADQIGKTFSIKLLSFNVWGAATQSLADVESYTYTTTGWSPPSDPANLFATSSSVAWQQPKRDADLAGWVVRTLAGRSRSWAQGADWPYPGAITTTPQIALSDLGAGVQTVMVRSVDTLGNLSDGILYLTLILGLGEASPENLIFTYDDAVAGFPGTTTGGSVVDGELVADSSGELYLPDANALYLPVIGSDYLPGAWDQMTYEFTYAPPYEYAPARLLLDSTVVADGWQIFTRKRGAGLYLQHDDDAYLPDEGPYLGGAQPFTSFSGAVEFSQREAIDIRIVTEAGSRRGTISALAVKVDVPDVTESIQNLSIAVGGTRIPLTKTYRAVDYIGTIAVQDTGTGAVSVVYVDKDPTLGPLLIALDSSGSSVSALVDIQDLKGH